jgi:hypothetical protein
MIYFNEDEFSSMSLFANHIASTWTMENRMPRNVFSEHGKLYDHNVYIEYE